jgi:cytochrome c peroxidase
MKQVKSRAVWSALAIASLLVTLGSGLAQERGQTSYAPVDIKEPFASIMTRMVQAKSAIEKRQADLLNERYDLSNRPAPGITMSRDKPVQEGVRVKLPAGMTWETLAATSPDEIREKKLFPRGFYPLPHPNHPEGGMLFPKFEIEEVKKQEGRDLTRFDLDYDLPDHFLPEFPAPIYLTTRPDLGDVSKGKLVTIDNYYELFSGILNPKQLEGLRLLVTPFPQQQFNQTEDRRSERPSRGVACLDCHANGHTNASTHLVGDIRPQEFRHRLDTPSLRGVNIQRLFGSQRALKSVEDFTEFEQRAAYFDGDPVIATKKGINILERGSQVHDMAEFQELLDFPPAPKLNILGALDPKKATASELRGQEVFFGKAKCGICHQAPYYTDNLMHNLQTERFYKPQMINGRMASADGPIKTFPLRGIKDSPPYLHDGRLLTLEDTVEFFNVILGTQLMPQEKQDLVAFLRAL